jgi:hypothetical protein
MAEKENPNVVRLGHASSSEATGIPCASLDGESQWKMLKTHKISNHQPAKTFHSCNLVQEKRKKENPSLIPLSPSEITNVSTDAGIFGRKNIQLAL